MDIDFHPTMNILNGFKAPEINFTYDWFGDENDLLFPKPGPEALRNGLNDVHLVIYEELRRVIQYDSLAPLQRLLSELYRDEGFTSFKSASLGPIAQMELMLTPLHVGLDKLRVPEFILELTNLLNPSLLSMPSPGVVATHAQQFISNRSLIMEPQVVISGYARRVFCLSAKNFKMIEPMEISCAAVEPVVPVVSRNYSLQQDTIELEHKVYVAVGVVQKQDNHNPALAPVPITKPLVSTTKKTNKKSKSKKSLLHEQSEQNSVEKTIIVSIPPPTQILNCNPWRWMYLCEAKLLIRVFVAVLR